MKILFLTNKSPYPPKDGGSIASFGLMNAVAELENQVTVLAMNTHKHHITPFDIPEKVKAKMTIHLAEVPALINMQGLLKNLLFSKLPYNAERFISKTFQKKLKSLLQHQTFDIIQLEGLYTIPYISTIRKYSNAIVSYRSHNVEYEIWERSAQNANWLKKPYLKVLASRIQKFEIDALNKYDTLIAITKRDQMQLAKLGNQKPAITIPSGISAKQINDEGSFENALSFIGALDWYPNQEGLLWFIENCWNEILRQRPNTNLYIAGRNAPQWLIDKLKLPNVSYLGEVDDAYQFMNQYSVMIAPLLSGSGMRVKLIEGMAQGKAIVTTSVGCEGIPVTNGNELKIANEVDVFVANCVMLLNSENSVREMGKQAINFVTKHYDNKILAEKLINYYKQLNDSNS